MATAKQFEDVIARINTATNRVAAIVADAKAKLAEALSNAGLLGPEEQAVLDSLGAAATTLEAVGADPENPTPGEEEPPVEDPEPA